jgi:hypothetical protein
MLFGKLNVSLAMFPIGVEQFSEKLKNNFDFLLQPFSLLHLATVSDIERIAGFEEKAFILFASSQLVIPESPTAPKQTEIRD